MSEFIPHTPENETTEERFFWDNVIHSLDILSDVEEEIHILEELEGLRDEEREDALTLLFNYALQVTVPEGESSDLNEVISFLSDEGFLDFSEESDEDYQ